MQRKKTGGSIEKSLALGNCLLLGAAAVAGGGVQAADLAVDVVQEGSVISEPTCTLVSATHDGTKFTVEVSSGCISTGPAAGINASSTSVSLAEGNTTQVSVSLASAPASDVTVPIQSSNTGTATVSKSQLIFAANTLTTQTFNITAVQDNVDVASRTATVALGPATSQDSAYSGRSGPSIGVTVTNTVVSSNVDQNEQDWRPSANLRVVTPMASSKQNYYPACVLNGELPSSSGCGYEGELAANEVWAHRVPWNGENYPGSLRIQFKRPEIGETYYSFDVAVSRRPGDFSQYVPTGVCTFTASSPTINLMDQTVYDDPSVSSILKNNVCILNADTVYYVNFRPSGTRGANCGTTETCRAYIEDNTLNYRDWSMFPWTLP